MAIFVWSLRMGELVIQVGTLQPSRTNRWGLKKQVEISNSDFFLTEAATGMTITVLEQKVLYKEDRKKLKG